MCVHVFVWICTCVLLVDAQAWPALCCDPRLRNAHPTSPFNDYNVPRRQAYAAEELYRREWRFHREMKLWIKEEVRACV